MFALAGILVAGCDAKEAREDGSAGAGAATPERAEAQPSPDEQRGAPVLALAATGLEPGLPFGTPKAAAIAVAAKTFGPPTAEDRVVECGAGPMEFARFRALARFSGRRLRRLVGGRAVSVGGRRRRARR